MNKSSQIVKKLSGFFMPTAKEIAQYRFNTENHKSTLSSKYRETNQQLSDAVNNHTLVRTNGVRNGVTLAVYCDKQSSSKMGINNYRDKHNRQKGTNKTGITVMVRDCMERAMATKVIKPGTLASNEATRIALMNFIKTSGYEKCKEIRQSGHDYEWAVKEVVVDTTGRISDNVFDIGVFLK